MNSVSTTGFQKLIRLAAVVDGDNLFRDANDRRISPDFSAFADALRERGVRSTTILQNFFKPHERLVIRQLPFIFGLATGENCDKKAMLVAIEYVLAGLDWLILGTGDADYLPLVEATQYAGTRVEIWCRRTSASRHLINAADSVRWIDDLLTSNGRPSTHRVTSTTPKQEVA